MWVGFYSEPEPVSDLIVSVTTNSGLSISWTLDTNSTGRVDSLQVSSTLSADDVQILDPDVTSADVDGLDAGSMYTITVVTVSGNLSSTEASFTTYTRRQLVVACPSHHFSFLCDFY